MSLNFIKQVRGYLISSSYITAIVPSTDIRVGWIKSADSFPCITINQVTGSDVGYLGYNTSTAGSKLRKEETSVQLDIFSQTSRLQTIQIADLIVPLMISGGCRKESDIDDYISEFNTYRKIQTYTCIRHFDD